jgi:hypothetical protein
LQLGFSDSELQRTGARHVLECRLQVRGKVVSLEELDNCTPRIWPPLERLYDVIELINPVQIEESRAVCAIDSFSVIRVFSVPRDVVIDEIKLVGARQIPQKFADTAIEGALELSSA